MTINYEDFFAFTICAPLIILKEEHIKYALEEISKEEAIIVLQIIRNKNNFIFKDQIKKLKAQGIKERPEAIIMLISYDTPYES